MSENNYNENQNNENQNNENNLLRAVKKGESTDFETRTKNFLKRTIGKENLISSNVYLIGFMIFLIVISIMLFLLSNVFRSGRSVSNIKTYHNYQNIKNFDYNKGITFNGKQMTQGNDKLINYHIASSFNSCNTKNRVFDYLHKDIVKNILISGARYLEVKIFNSEYGEDTEKITITPVINNGLNKGEWKLCFTDIQFEDLCIILKKNAFSFLKKVEDNSYNGVPNPKDPLFLALDLKTNNNTTVLNKLSNMIVKYLGDYLLPRQYRDYKNTTKNLNHITMNELKEKLVILCSNGHEGSLLTNLINGCWGDNGNIDRYYFKELEEYAENSEAKQNFDNSRLSIVIPDKDEKDGKIDTNIFNPLNYNTKLAFDLGCNFISVYYQSVDSNMDYYITKFRNNSIIRTNKAINS